MYTVPICFLLIKPQVLFKLYFGLKSMLFLNQLTKNLPRLYVGEPMKETTGLTGTFVLCFLGQLYNFCAVGFISIIEFVILTFFCFFLFFCIFFCNINKDICIVILLMENVESLFNSQKNDFGSYRLVILIKFFATIFSIASFRFFLHHGSQRIISIPILLAYFLTVFIIVIQTNQITLFYADQKRRADIYFFPSYFLRRVKKITLKTNTIIKVVRPELCVYSTRR